MVYVMYTLTGLVFFFSVPFFLVKFNDVFDRIGDTGQERTLNFCECCANAYCNAKHMLACGSTEP